MPAPHDLGSRDLRQHYKKVGHGTGTYDFLRALSASVVSYMGKNFHHGETESTEFDLSPRTELMIRQADHGRDITSDTGIKPTSAGDCA